jgi:DNA-binding CsgD family transcriptional regulator
MVGRSAPLSRLVGLLGTEPSGGPSVALVSGEAGVGKTRLLRELMAAVPSGVAVLAGQAEQGGLGRPWELVASVLGGELPLEGPDRLGAATSMLLDRLGSGRSLVIFEDLHWADAESVTVFERLAAVGPAGLLMVGTYRPEELSRRLPGGEMLARLERRQHVHQLRLERLGRAEVGAFLGAVFGRALPAAVTSALHARTGGNPFFLEELVGSAGDIPPDELADQPLPWSLAELVGRQLDGLTPHERRVVEAAAVLGRRAPFDVLADMLGASEGELILQLRSLVERGVLVEECEDEFTFRHALVRDAVESQLLGRERRRLHALALAALQRSARAGLAELAGHAARAGHYDEMIELARQGVNEYLANGSTYQALALACEALAEAPDDRGLLAGAARAAWLLGLNDEAGVHGRRWYELVSAAGSLEERSRATRLLGRVAHELDDYDLMWRLVDEAKALEVELGSSEERAAALAFIAQANMLHNQADEAVRWADRAAVAADEVGAKGVRAQALVERASAISMMKGRRSEGAAALREAAHEAELAGDWVLVARAVSNLIGTMPPACEDTLDLIERVREFSMRAGFDAMGVLLTEVHAATWAIEAGDMAMVRRHLDRFSELTPIAKGELVAWHRHLLARLAIEEGKPHTALEILAQTSAGRPPEEVGHHDVLVAMAAAQLGDGPRVEGLLDAFDLGDDDCCGRKGMSLLLDLMEAAAMAGLGGPALRERVLAPRRDEIDVLGGLEVCEAIIASVEGRHEDVLANLLAAQELAVPLSRYRGATLRLAAARSLMALGRRAEAREQVVVARAMLERWPGWRRDEADAMLRRIEGPGGEAVDGELTARERDVAALLAEGLSNAEVARRLYISPKTAAVHVSNILTKLGMANRAEVAAWAVRSGLVGSDA